MVQTPKPAMTTNKPRMTLQSIAKRQRQQHYSDATKWPSTYEKRQRGSLSFGALGVR